MPSILLIDHDPYYARRLADRLGQLLAIPIQARSASEPRLAEEITILATTGVVVIADPALKQAFLHTDQELPGLAWVAWPAKRPGTVVPTESLYRLMPASQMATVLSQRLSGQNSPAFATGKSDASPEPTDHNLTMALDLGWEGHRDFVANWLDQQVKAGGEVFYLPFMPNYRMTLVQAPGAGPNLTQLLLRLANGDALSPSELGTYLERHRKGYWQFRPAERSDDLVQADPAWLRSIVVLVREKFRSLGPGEAATTERLPPVVLIDCQGLSFSRAAQIAVLADQLAVFLGSATDWASSCAQRELGELIARLPTSCQVLEMKPVDRTSSSVHGQHRTRQEAGPS